VPDDGAGTLPYVDASDARRNWSADRVPNVDLIAVIVEVVHLRQAGVPRTAVESRLVSERRIPRHAARRLIGEVDHELQAVRRRMALPLALSAEALASECVPTMVRVAGHN
jgi:hypothetical protein